ncbi:ceramide glucosyltransferase-B [Aplysia californica]|uniref:ceramide glucosyltransferase n=1 Tax=Aplysia californica TaxID=6500 RepID=A0ABM0K0U3_APLCA|nr:ceramide glucosyltransferase-B [Aplysia californica]
MTVDYSAIGATILAIIIIVGWSFSWVVHIISLCYGIRHLHKKLEPPVPADGLPGVSVIKPLTGVDVNLKSNLESCFNQCYPNYELLFCVQDDNDPAILVVKSLIESYPKVDAKLFIGQKDVGPNGKINNMVSGYEAAKYDLIIISDTGIKMTPNSIYDMVWSLEPDVGLVLQMPYCATRKGFGAVYQQVYFGTMQARNCLSANAVNINCSTGMSSMLRRDVLDKAGGLAEFGQYLAEDHFIAEAIRAHGYRVVLATTPALQNSGNTSLSDFHKRLVRWSQLRISMVPTLIVIEPVGESIVLGVLASWATMFLFDASPLAFFLSHLLVWFLFDYILIRIVENGPLPFSKFEFVVAWLMREVLSPYIILVSHLNDHVVWRNKKYRIRWGGKVEVPISNKLEKVEVAA